jgi:hypothetical protein
VLVGASAAVLLGACGGSGDSADSKDSATGDSDARDVNPVLFQAQGTVISGIPQRIPVGLRNADGSIVSRGPDLLTADVTDLDGKPLGQSLTARRHAKGLAVPYWPFVTTFAAPGAYRMAFKEIDVAVPFSVVEPALHTVPTVGAAMPALTTPTPVAPDGVDPICTASPACPLHTVSLDAALTDAKPIAFLLGTPAYCQTGVCGPILDLMLAQQKRLGDAVTFLHNEVYAKPYEDSSTPTTPAVSDLGLTFEPVIWLIGADGVIRQRIDVIVDEDELTEALDALIA